MFCGKCGKQLHENSTFCGGCGTKMGETPSTVTPPVQAQSVETPPVQAQPVEPPPVQAQPVEPPPVQAQPVEPPPVQAQPVETPPVTAPPQQEKSTTAKTVAKGGTLAVVVALCLGVGYLGGVMVKEGSSDSDSNSSSSSGSNFDSNSNFDSSSNSNSNASDTPTSAPEREDTVVVEEEVRPAQYVDISVSQVDVSAFPVVRFFANVENSAGEPVDVVELTDFSVIETLDNVQSLTYVPDSIQSASTVQTSFNLVMDISESMVGDKITNSKKGFSAFLKGLSGNVHGELTLFDSYVYVSQRFTPEISSVVTAVESASVGNGSALYDAMYSALIQTFHQNGAKFVVVLTDGGNEGSNYSYQNVVELSRNTGIPVYIMGIGMSVEQTVLEQLASDCGGVYYSIETSEAETLVEKRLNTIYEKHQEQFLFQFTSTLSDSHTKDVFRTLSVVQKDGPYQGSVDTSYIPVPDLSGSFQEEYAYTSSILSHSSTSTVNDSDLIGLSLAELRIARNEIYARHGRLFLDSKLNEWFYSKEWYLSIYPKYSPTQFGNLSPFPLSALEQNNIQVILDYENYLMAYELIFPQGATVLLSEYDVALSKAVLQTALGQLYQMEQTTILSQNIAKVNDAISKL